MANSGESVVTADNLLAARKTSVLAGVKGEYINVPVASIKTRERQPLKTFTQPPTLADRSTQVIPVNYNLIVPPGTYAEQADFTT